jgi:hypothetical protein
MENTHETIEYVGGYNVTGSSKVTFKITFTKKPNIIHRFFSRILLGWVWVDN